MWYVRLIKPLPKVRPEIFFFTTQAEADEFASCLHAYHYGVETESGEAGRADEVFEDWSF
jgi:hypothetical protein